MRDLLMHEAATRGAEWEGETSPPDVVVGEIHRRLRITATEAPFQVGWDFSIAGLESLAAARGHTGVLDKGEITRRLHAEGWKVREANGILSVYP